MYAKSRAKASGKTVKTLLFADVDVYDIPASEGWNEGYSKANKFLYFKEATSTATGESEKLNWLSTSSN